MLGAYGVSAEAAAPVVRALTERPEAWIDFMMRFELGLEKPDPRRGVVSAVTIAGAYIAGGLIPLALYVIVATAARALAMSIACTLRRCSCSAMSKDTSRARGPFGVACRPLSWAASLRLRPLGLRMPFPDGSLAASGDRPAARQRKSERSRSGSGFLGGVASEVVGPRVAQEKGRQAVSDE